MPSSGTISQIKLPNGNIYDLDSEVGWEDVENKPSTFPPESHNHTKSEITDFSHTHDDRYYTESEVNDALSGKANSSHTHTKSEITDFPSLLTLGETSETAYRGDRGKIAYDHSQASHAPANAEANQNAFSNITVGSTTIAADSTTDTFTLTAGSNVTLTPDATNDKITIAATDTTYSSKSAASGGTDVSLVTTGEKYTWNNKSSFSGNYNDLTNKPTIPTVPTNVSAFTNDAGYLTQHQDISGKQDTLVSGTNIKTVNGNSLLGSGNINISGGGNDYITEYGSETAGGATWKYRKWNSGRIEAWATPTIPNIDCSTAVKTGSTTVFYKSAGNGTDITLPANLFTTVEQAFVMTERDSGSGGFTFTARCRIQNNVPQAVFFRTVSISSVNITVSVYVVGV